MTNVKCFLSVSLTILGYFNGLDWIAIEVEWRPVAYASYKLEASGQVGEALIDASKRGSETAIWHVSPGMVRDPIALQEDMEVCWRAGHQTLPKGYR